MDFLKKLKNAITNFFTGGGTKATPPRPIQNPTSRRVVSSNTQSGRWGAGNGTTRRNLLDALFDDDERRKKAREQKTYSDAYKAKSVEFKSLASGGADKTAPKSLASEQKKGGDFKTELRKSLDDTKKSLTEYHKATDHRYDVKGAKDAAEKLKRRQAQKSQAYDYDADIWTTKTHPIAMSAARGAASGASFGLTDRMAAKGTKGKAREAEEYYQAHKNKAAETAGEIAGSLASFALTAGGTEKLGGKLISRYAPNAAERLAQTELLKGAAKRGVEKAVKKGIVKEASEELIKQVGKDKAKKIVAAVGTDIVQNATTGLLYDFNRASEEHEIGSSDWWKEMGKSAAFNAAITGGIAGASTLRSGKGIVKEAANKLARNDGVEEAVENAVKRAPKEKGIVEFPPRDESTIEVINPDAKKNKVVEIGAPEERIEVINPDIRAGKTVEIGAPENGIEVINPDIKRGVASAPFDAPENTAYNIYKGGVDNEAQIGNIGRAQAGGETVPRVDAEISARGGADNGVVGRVADASDNARRGGGDGLLRVSPENRAKLTESGVPDTYLSDVSDNYAAFSNALDEARASNPHGGWVDPKSTKDLASHNAKAYLSKDGYAGVAVEGDGNISGVFKNPQSEHKGAIYDLIYTARANGGTKMDCFGKELANCYEGCGYTIVGRVKHNSEFVTDPLLKKLQPDVYVLMKNTDDLDTVASKIRKPESAGGYHRSTQEELDKLPLFGKDDYEAALKYRDDRLAKQEAEAAVKEAEAIPFTNEKGVPITGETTQAAKEDFPYAMVDDSMPSTNPQQTIKNEVGADLKNRVDEIAEQEVKEADDVLKVNKVSADDPISEGTTSGVKQIRSAYEYNNGEPIEGGTMTKWKEAWKASQEYSASHATGEKVRQSKVAVSQLNAMDSEAERALREKLVESGDLNYEAINSSELYDRIAKEMRDDPDRWVKDMIDINEGGALDFRNTPEWQARVQYILGTVDPSADPASEIAYTEAFKLAQNISSKGGQTLNLRRNFVHLTPLGKRDAILDDFINILDKSKGFRKNHAAMSNLGKYDRRHYIRNILMQDEAIMDGVQKVVKADNVDDVSEAFTELMYTFNKSNPKTGFDVLQELRYLNMLGNPKTHIRNVFGSGFFAPMRQVSNAIRSGLENPIAKYASSKAGVKMEVARHGGLLDGSLRDYGKTEAGKACEEAFERMKDQILGSAKYETQMYGGRGKTVAGKTLDALSDFNSTLLTKEDDFFRSRAFKENYIKSYNRYLKDGKPITEKVRRQIEQDAIRESQIATFNEYNEFAAWLNNLQRGANDVNASALKRWGGRAANAAMPFTKVPANLMKQSVNYSPLGLARGMAGIKKAAASGDAAALNKAVDELASGLTGTAVFGLGMLLGKTTHNMFGKEVNVTTNTGKNDPAAKFNKDRGMQNYSITFKDPETGQGHSFTLDWLVPISATFFSGVEFMSELQKGNINASFLGDWSTVMSRLAEPVLETSMMSGLHGMLETLRSGSKSDDGKGAIDILIRELGQSYLNSIIPTMLGQAARTAYSTDKQIVGDTDWEYWRNQTKSKAGLANVGIEGDSLAAKIIGEPLGADTDAYGNIKGEKGNTLLGAIKEGDAKSLGEYGKSALKNFLSPANIQKVDFSAIDREKLKTYEEAVKNGADPEKMAYLFPKKQYKKSFKVAGEDVKMSNKDLSAYNQAKATGGEEGMRYVLENIMFNRRTTDENGKNVPADSAYTKEQKQALMAQFKGKSMRDVEKWLYAQPEFKSATDAERKKAIEGLWDLTKDSNTVASQRVGEQAAIKSQGGDVDEYNFKNEVTEKKRDALMPAIEAGILTFAQAVDFDRNAAKMGYYETEEGGYSKASYNREGILAYLDGLDASEETKKALYDAYYTGKTPYGEDVKRGRRGYGRRRGYRRRSYGRRSSGGKKAATPELKIDAKAYKAEKQTYKSLAETLPKSSSTKRAVSSYKVAKSNTAAAYNTKATTKKTTVKAKPPTVKFKKYEV